MRTPLAKHGKTILRAPTTSIKADLHVDTAFALTLKHNKHRPVALRPPGVFLSGAVVGLVAMGKWRQRSWEAVQNPQRSH